MQGTARLNELPQEQRGRKRSRVLLAAMLRSGEHKLNANLLNLSTTGAQLDASDPPPVNSEVTLSRGNLETRGRVIWVSEHRFGVAFDEPIDEAMVAEHVDALTPRKKVALAR